MNRKRKNIPAEKLLNYMLAQILCDRKTAQNLIDDGRADLAQKWNVSARTREIDAMEIISWIDAWPVHIFDYHNARPKNAAGLLQRLNAERIERRGK